MTKSQVFTLKDCNFQKVISANGGRLAIYDLPESMVKECEFGNCEELATNVELLAAHDETDDAMTFSCREHLEYVIKLCTDSIEYKVLHRTN
jgi:hypothetical protein